MALINQMKLHRGASSHLAASFKHSVSEHGIQPEHVYH